MDTSEKIYGCRETEHAENAEAAAAEEETMENKPKGKKRQAIYFYFI